MKKVLQKRVEGRCSRAIWGWGLALGVFFGGAVPSLASDGGGVARLLDNGGFQVEAVELPGEAFVRVPWWRPVLWSGGGWAEAPRGWPAVSGLVGGDLPRVEGGELFVPLAGAWVAQPVAAWAPLAGGMRLTGRVRGAGRVLVRGGDGDLFEVDLTPSDTWTDFAWEPPKDGLQPRFEVALGCSGEGGAWFDDVEVRVPLVTTSEAALDDEVAGLVVELLDELLEIGHDRVGPRETAFWVGLHDVDTGALVGAPFARAGLTPLHAYLVQAIGLGLGGRAGASGETLAARHEAMAREFLELCIQPQTHLPRRYDPLADKPVDVEPLEVAAYLGYVIDLAGGAGIGSALPERKAMGPGLPDEVVADALAAATAMGRALLDVAVLPDGNVAALVRPSDGWVSTSVVHLRRLDVPAQLVRLAALLRRRGLEPELQAELVAAAREAVFEVEFANYWPGTWKTIDPGFDDSYGHIGARSQTMAAAWPDEPAFARLALGGRAKYSALWHDALAFGGNIAADQVRCWQVFIELARLTPDAPESQALPGLLRQALRLHFKGEATTTGSWLDVTVLGFDPATNLPVGDVIGLPQNQLAGLAFARHARLGLDDAETRAMFATLLESAKAEYGGKAGFSGGTSRSSVGSVRILPGLLGWL